MHPHVAELERLAFCAWPAEGVVELGGWRLRYTQGVTRRGNSVWLGTARCEPSLQRALSQVEAFYSEQRLPARYQVTPVDGWEALDRALQARGYSLDAPTAIRTASVDAVLSALPAPPGVSVEVASEATEPWFEISGRRGRFAAVTDIYRGILNRIRAPAGYALAKVDGQPAGVGLGVCQERQVGVFSMLVLPPYRRRGVGAAVLRGLASWAAERAARGLYLQVERDNPGALALYENAGFREVYSYHYRVAEPAPGTPRAQAPVCG